MIGESFITSIVDGFGYHISSLDVVHFGDENDTAHNFIIEFEVQISRVEARSLLFRLRKALREQTDYLDTLYVEPISNSRAEFSVIFRIREMR